MSMYFVKVMASEVDIRDAVGPAKITWIDLGKIPTVTMKGASMIMIEGTGTRLQIDARVDIAKITRILDKLAYDFSLMYDRWGEGKE